MGLKRLLKGPEPPRAQGRYTRPVEDGEPLTPRQRRRRETNVAKAATRRANNAEIQAKLKERRKAANLALDIVRPSSRQETKKKTKELREMFKTAGSENPEGDADALIKRTQREVSKGNGKKTLTDKALQKIASTIEDSLPW